MPPSRTSSAWSVRSVVPRVPSHAPSFWSLSLNERQKHDSFNLSGSVFLVTSDGKVLGLPVPSESPHDPLNWSNKKKALALLSTVLFSWTCLTLTQGASQMKVGLSSEFENEHINLFMIEALLTAPTLLSGIGTLFWVPLTLALGRRPPFITATILMLLASVGAGLSTRFWQLLACVSILGFTEGFALSVVFLIIIDLTFIHQRPWAMAIILSINGSLGICSLSSVPFVTSQGMKWRNFYFSWSIAAGLTFLSALLFFPETYFKRPVVAYDGLTLLQTASEKLIVYDDDTKALNWTSYNKELPEPPSRNWIWKVIDRIHPFRIVRTSWNSMLLCYPQIFFCLFNPLIFWVVIVTAVNFAGVVLITSTSSMILSHPPYNLPSSLRIHVNTSAGFGILLACPIGGSFVSFFLQKLSRNKGIREAEHYLIGYILPVTTGALSTLMYGFAVYNKWRFGLYYLVHGFSGFSFVLLTITNTLWVTEAFPRWAAPALAVIGGVSSIVSFAISFTLMPWVRAQGYRQVGIGLSLAQVLSGFIFLPIAFWGKGIRQRIHGRWAEGREGALRPL